AKNSFEDLMNLLSNKLFNDVLKSNYAQRTVILAGMFRHQDHVGLSFLEKVDDIQAAGLGSGFWQSGQTKVGNLHTIFRVIGDKNFDQQHAHEVCWFSGSIDWDATVSRAQDGIGGRFVQNGIGTHAEDVVNGRHDGLNRLVFQIQNSGNNCDLVLVETIGGSRSQRLVKGHQGLEPCLLVDGTMVLAQNSVEQQRNGVRYRISSVHKSQY